MLSFCLFEETEVGERKDGEHRPADDLVGSDVGVIPVAGIAGPGAVIPQEEAAVLRYLEGADEAVLLILDIGLVQADIVDVDDVSEYVL